MRGSFRTLTILLAGLVILTGVSVDAGAETPSNAGVEGSTVCSTEEAKRSAKSWNYNPVDAYKFGLKIQHYVEQEDLQSLFGLVQGELSYGPRKKYIRGKLFSEIFSKTWRETVLSEKPDCGPVGWRGFMLGNGNIWYHQDYETRKWEIFSINNELNIEADKSPLDGSWKFKEELLTSDCFATIWMSGDNYQYHHENFGEKHGVDWDDFFSSPGRYIGGPIPIAPMLPLGPNSSQWMNCF
ncbi:MAG: hypothetical protein HOJ87_05855 [Rhodospirillaceae bacterium]|jgi:hypothetical protein|nr:hypothetical protein [Rhodospirillaceae bacterium]MBT5561858.1 hypothetical protein [Rhodospirillaceae bacterium]